MQERVSRKKREGKGLNSILMAGRSGG